MQTKNTLYLLLFLIVPLFSLAQSTIKGVIIDEETKTVIPLATIQVGISQKTLTNQNGEFELNVNALPALITISHISYQTIQINIKEANNLLTIELKPVVFNLTEVVIENYALTLMRNALAKAKENYQEPNYAKAFLTQFAYENDKPTYLNEIYFNANWKNYGLTAWKPTDTRHLKKDVNLTYTNVSFISLAFSGFLYNDANLKPLCPKLDSLYSFKIKNTFKQGDAEIAIITCTPKTKISKVHFEGNYYLNTETYNVLRIEGVFNGIKMNAPGPVGIKNKGVNFMAQYKINENGKSVLDFSTLNLKMKMTVFGIGTKNTEFDSSLYLLDYNDKYNTDLKEIQKKTNDIKTTKEITYNADFWKNSTVVKRTQREVEAVKILEATPQVIK